jgi:hypothetical protein
MGRPDQGRRLLPLQRRQPGQARDEPRRRRHFSQCLAVDAGIDPTAGFVAADHDSAGNIYVTYTEKGGGRDTYLVALRPTR